MLAMAALGTGAVTAGIGNGFMSIMKKPTSGATVSPSSSGSSNKQSLAEKAASKAAPALPTGNEMVDTLVLKLKACHLDVTTDWTTAKEVIKELPDRFKHLKENEKEIRGFVFSNKVFINPEGAQADVPIHEYTHIWAEALRQQNDAEWKKIVTLLKNETNLWEEVKAKYPHLTNDNEIANEVLATYSGRHGRERLEQHAKNGDTPEKTIENVLEALRHFWEHVAKFFKMKQGRDYNNLDDISDRVLADLLKGVNPTMYIDKNKMSLSDTMPLPSMREADDKPLDFNTVKRQLATDGMETVHTARPIEVVYMFDRSINIKEAVPGSDTVKKGDTILGLSLDSIRQTPYDTFIIQRDGRIIDRKIDRDTVAALPAIMETIDDMKQRGALFPIVGHTTDMDASGNDKALQWPKELSFDSVWSDRFNTHIHGDNNSIVITDEQYGIHSFIEADKCIRQGVAERRLFDAAITAVADRANNSSQDAAFTEEQCDAIHEWLTVHREAPGLSADTLWTAVQRHPSVRGIPEEWMDDTKRELNDFVYSGMTRSHDEHGIRR